MHWGVRGLETNVCGVKNRLSASFYAAILQMDAEPSKICVIYSPEVGE